MEKKLALEASDLGAKPGKRQHGPAQLERIGVVFGVKETDQTTASPGESTRVETTVAIELAASWNPLKKSNTNAMATTVTKSKRGKVTTCGLPSRLHRTS